MDYSKHFSPKATKQTEKVPEVKKQKKNNAGGIAFKITKWEYLKRFLILGTEGGTYYAGERSLTVSACKNVQKCIDTNGRKAVSIIVDVSMHGRAANNDSAIFALAMAASSNNPDTRKYALSKLDSVCRISTHLFHFINYVKTMRGFGRGLREGIARWYTDKSIPDLAYQMLKYQQRDGWSHRDVIRLAHPQPVNKKMNKLFAHAVGKREGIPKVSEYAIGMREVSETTSQYRCAELITKYNLTREAIPTRFLGDVGVWEALLPNMPMTALVRNLGKMSSLDMHIAFTSTLKLTVEKLTNEVAVKKSRIHPMQLMNAMLTYKMGKGMRGSLTWVPSRDVLDALEDAFYMSFKNIEPTGKRIMLALDVSGSMTGRLNNSLMTCRDASAVLAMCTMRAEPNTAIVGFTGMNSYDSFTISNGNSWGKSAIAELPIGHRMTLDSVIKEISNLPFSVTDCALPFIYCEGRGIDVDAVVIYTDNETWAGTIHPWQALDSYQQKVGHEVRSIVVGMTTTGFSIARPDYHNMLDVVGMDTATPKVISEFLKD